MNYKAKESGEWERTYLMWGDEVEDDGNGVPGQCFCCSLLLLVSSFLLCSLFSLVLSSFLWSSLPCLFLESAACKRRWWCGRVVPPTWLPLLCFIFPLLSGLFSSLLRLSPLCSSFFSLCFLLFFLTCSSSLVLGPCFIPLPCCVPLSSSFLFFFMFLLPLSVSFFSVSHSPSHPSDFVLF